MVPPRGLPRLAHLRGPVRRCRLPRCQDPITSSVLTSWGIQGGGALLVACTKVWIGRSMTSPSQMGPMGRWIVGILATVVLLTLCAIALPVHAQSRGLEVTLKASEAPPALAERLPALFRQLRNATVTESSLVVTVTR